MLNQKRTDPIAALAAEPERLQAAWAAVRGAGGGPGIDGQTIDRFAVDSQTSLKSIENSLRGGTYRFSRLRSATIPRAHGNPRKLGIPTVCDRIVLQSIRNAIEPACDRLMLDCSHAYRTGRGAMTAIAQVAQAVASGRQVVLETDVQNFFDSIRHRTLLEDLAAMEPRTVGSRLLASTLALSPGYWNARKGVAQGSPLSPLLANVALTRFDRELQSSNWTLVRYADDLLVLCQTVELAQMALESIERALRMLGLTTHPDKTSIVDSRQAAFRYLGFEFHPDRIAPDASNLGKLRDGVLAICNPHSGVPWPSRIEQLNAIIRSFAWYYHQADTRRLFWTLDEFVVEQLTHLQAQIGPPERPWQDQIIKMARMRDVRWLGKSKRQVNGWNGYGS